jgi:hypothetical protein
MQVIGNLDMPCAIGPLLPPAGHAHHCISSQGIPHTLAHLLLWVLERNHQHHIASFELQLISVSGRVIMLGLNL